MLYRKGSGMEARLCFIGHALMEMYLPNLDAAKEEATRVCHDLVAMQEDLSESAIQIADAGGELLFTVPCAE
jgi:hypothetical protein